MERMICCLRLLAVFIFAANIVGCASMELKPQEEKERDNLIFVDTSKGLPAEGQWRQGISFFDMNQDGLVDILAPPPRHGTKETLRPHLWYGGPNGEWREGTLHVPGSAYGYGDIAVADFDGDGVPDIGLAAHGEGLRVLKGIGGERYADFSRGLPPSSRFSSRALVAADFNNDGIPDLAAVSEGKFGDDFPEPSGIMICSCVNNRWECHGVGDEEEVSGLYADQIFAGDVNGDGHKDIAVGSLEHTKTLIIWIGDGKGGFKPFNKGIPKKRHYLSVALADINDDGRDDLIVSTSAFGADQFIGIKAFLSKPEGFEDISEGLPGKELFYAVGAADLNGDGSVEIVGATASGGLKVFSLSLSGDQWGQTKVSGLPEKGLIRMSHVYCLDLNGDGRKDIAVNYASERHESGGIRVFLNRSPSGI